MKEIVIISGKGGTGKTSIAASIAVLAGKEAIIADCDVDAADMHMLMSPDFDYKEDFYSGKVAYINQGNCIQCGKCTNVCRFGAITFKDHLFKVDSFSCEGCGYCSRVCSVDAITNKERLAGEWYISTIKTGSKMVHARLKIGADNSGKLVAKVKNEAKELAREKGSRFVIIDGSPGIGCPVVSSLSGADFVILVAEPSVSGVHDLKRVCQVVKKFHLKAGCVINKADVNKEKYTEIIDFLMAEQIVHLADLPYHENFTKAMVQRKTIVEYDQAILKEMLKECWEKIKTIVL
jgi:MinD superfamily P-loop ATPase